MKQNSKKTGHLLKCTGIYCGCYLYLEVILHILCDIPFSLAGLTGSLFMAAGLAALSYLLSSFFASEKKAKWICVVLMELQTILYVAAYFTDNSFTVFMDLKTMFMGAEDVMTDFSDRIVVLFTKGMPCILLFHVPVILFIIFSRKIGLFGKGNARMRILALALVALFPLLGHFLYVNIPNTKDVATSSYDYNSAVRSLGLVKATELSLRFDLFGNPYEDTIELAAAPMIDYGALEEDEEEVTLPEETKEKAGVEDILSTEPEEGIAKAESSEETALEEEVEEEEEKEIVYGYNVLDIDYERLIEETNDSTLENAYAFALSQTPSHKNPYTGLFRGKNLILITAEAFSKEVIDEQRTPTLYRMANRGIVFEDYYQPAWGGSTSTGEFSVLVGTIPVDGVSSVKKTAGHNMYFTIEKQLMRQGYFSRAYHNNTYTYYGRDLTHENFGYDKYIGYGNGMEEGVTKCWPESDLEMVEFTLKEYLDRQPFSIYYMTVSGHCLYNWGGNKMSSKNKEVVQDMDCSQTLKAYYACNMELEYAMEALVKALEDAGIADDTVICLTADHYPYGLSESTTWGNDKDYLAELYGYRANSNPTRDHSACIIWSGCLEDMEPIVIDTPTYSLDIQPTLSNLFGVKFDSRLTIGRDVLSDAQPLVIWNDHDWMTDLGYYEAGSGKFTPASEDIEVDKEYISQMKNIVKGKMAISKAVIRTDLYEYVISAWKRNSENNN